MCSYNMINVVAMLHCYCYRQCKYDIGGYSRPCQNNKIYPKIDTELYPGEAAERQR